MKAVHSLAFAFQGTPISEFKNMPVDELGEAVENLTRINQERERASRGV